MSGIFSPQGAPCGIFAPGFCGAGTMGTFTYVRADALLRHHTPTQNAAGEILNSFTTTVTVTGELQPNKGQLQRLIGGMVTEVAYVLFAMGAPDVQEKDRTVIEGWQVEVVAVNQWGGEFAEIFHTYLGR